MNLKCWIAGHYYWITMAHDVDMPEQGREMPDGITVKFTSTLTRGKCKRCGAISPDPNEKGHSTELNFTVSDMKWEPGKASFGYSVKKHEDSFGNIEEGPDDD